MPHEQRSLRALSPSESVDLLSRAQVGRVVFTERALPAVVPATFAVHGESVVLRTAADTRLATAADGGVLAFEADDLDPVTRTGWSVLVTGVAELVTDPAERDRIHRAVTPWAPGDQDVCIRLPLTVVTGRRIASSSSAPATSAV